VTERIMKWLLWTLLSLFLISVVAEAAGVKPLQRWLPNLPASTILAIALLTVLLSRTESVAAKMTEGMKTFGHAQEALKSTLDRVNSVSDEAKTLSAQLQELREQIAQSDLLLPARLAIMHKRFDDAAELLEEVVERIPDNRDARWLLGVALFRSRKAREALPHLRAAVSDTDPDQLELLAQCEHFLGSHRDAEAHVLRAMELRKPAPPQTVALLGSIQAELDPDRARTTLREALQINPRSSPVRYELVKVEIDTEHYDDAISIASEGFRLNDRDAGCLLGRAEARLRKGLQQDEEDILRDLDLAEKLNRRDATLYKLRGELYLRRANRMADATERERMLKNALAAYESGIGNIAQGWLRAALLASKARVLLLLQDFEAAAAAAKAAVEEAPGHVSNHIALVFARLAAGKWQPAAIAAEAGQNVGGWAGRVTLTAARIIALAMAGVEPEDLVGHCRELTDELEQCSGKFTPSEMWMIVKELILKKLGATEGAGARLVTDTICLLDSQISLATFRSRWTRSQ
jgi:tetratricopeptide (TPR) repeat protein